MSKKGKRNKWQLGERWIRGKLYSVGNMLKRYYLTRTTKRKHKKIDEETI
jgi:hypothetical protein